METAPRIDTSLIVRVEQIVEGEAKCYCHKDAVLVVTTEPDGDPGPACYTHAKEWIDFAISTTTAIFGPKEEKSHE